MKIEKPEIKDELNRRLRRIEGQLRGVQKMVDEGRDCGEILQQLMAVRAAVQGASQAFIQQAANECILNLDRADPPGRAALVKDLVDLLGKAA